MKTFLDKGGIYFVASSRYFRINVIEKRCQKNFINRSLDSNRGVPTKWDGRVTTLTT